MSLPPPATSAVTTHDRPQPAALAALAGLRWVEAVAASGESAVVSCNSPEGLGLELLEPGGALRPLAPGVRPDAGTMAVRGRRVACCLRDAAGLSRPAVVALDTLETTPLAVAASVRPRALAWLGDGEVVTVDDPDRGNCHLVAAPADGSGEVRRLRPLPAAPRWTDPRPSVAGDGRILHTVLDGATPRIDVLDAASGSVEDVLVGNPSATPQQASWSPAGDRALCLVRRAAGAQVVLLDLERESMDVLPLPGAGGLPAWSPDGTALAAQVDGWPASRVAVLDLGSGQVRECLLPPMVSAFGPVWQGGHVLCVASGPAIAPSVWRWDPASGQVERASPAFDLPPHPDPRAVRIPTAAGFDLPGLLHEPGHPRPDGAAVLFLHGGPSACWRAGWDPVATLFLSAGFRVLHGDTRGSVFTGWNMPRLGPGAFGRADVDDAAELVGYLSPAGEPVVVYAHSYGSFVAYRASLRDERVRALVLTSGFLDPADLEGSTDAEVRAFRAHAFGAQPATRQTRLPARCPVLMVHGEEDTQVPLAQAEDANARLDGHGHRLLRLDGEGHAFAGREQILRWMGEALGFVQDVLGGGAR